MAQLDKKFIAERRDDLIRIKDDLLRTLKMNTEEYNSLQGNISTEDIAAVASELEAKRARGQVELADRDTLRRVASALHRIDDDSYGVCLSCGAEIGEERLEAVPDAPLCISCQTRRDEQ